MATRSWFLYNGAVGAGAETNTNNYTYVSFLPNCSGGDVNCAILGIYQPNPYGVRPTPGTFASGKIQTYITNAKATGNAYPDPSGTGLQPYALPKS